VKTDSEIRDDVIEELRWDPQLTDPDAIGVADHTAKLYGHVHSRKEAAAARAAAAAAPGVAAVESHLAISS
jgi:osmotically-inducible protein OsmY